MKVTYLRHQWNRPSVITRSGALHTPIASFSTNKMHARARLSHSSFLNNPYHDCTFQVDPSGPLATLRKILLSEESIESLRNFLVTHWYSVILMAVAVLVLMVRRERIVSTLIGFEILVMSLVKFVFIN